MFNSISYFVLNTRTTAVAFSCNFTAVAFGGTSPIITMHLIRHYDSATAVAYYLMVTCLVTVIFTSSYVIDWSRFSNRHC